ncbi:hypothetical protein QTP88_000757 [Uroleucon formosanum]
MPSTPKITVGAVKSNNTLTLSDLAKMISTLSSNQDKSFKLINSRIDDLSTHLNKLDSALAECQNKTQRLEVRVKALETQKSALDNNYIDFSLIVRNVVLDVQKRSLNVILHGVKESIETVAKERIIHDNNKINELFTLLSINSDVIANISRLGHPSLSNQRPIKLILRNPCDADRILTSFMKVKRESPYAVQNISLVKDRTQAERRHIKEVYVDFKNRPEAGEKDIKPSVCINSLLSGYYQNVRGLRTKLNLLKCSIPSSTHDFIIFTETWLRNTFLDNELGFTQHNVFRRDRTEKTSPHNRDGGVLVAIKKTFNSILLNIDTLNVEQVFVKIIVGDILIIFCAVYFPPNSDLQLYLNHLSVLESIDTSFPNCKFIICGDYNIPSLSWKSDKHGLKCVNFLSSQVGSSLIESGSVLNLYQFNSIINAHGNILDLVFSNLLESSINLYDDPFVPIDPCHPPIQIYVRLPISQPILNNDRTIYNYVKGDYINANLFFNSFNWLNTFRHLNTEAAALVFQHALLEALRSFVPQKTISTSHNFPYWFNKELKTLVWKKNKAHSTYIKNKSKSNYEKFSLLRAQYKSQSKIDFHDFMHRSESEIISSPKYFWNWVNFNTKSHGILNSVFLGDTIANNGADIANLFSNYFSSLYNTSRVHSPDEPQIFASTYQFDHIIPNKCSISLNAVSDGLRTLIKCRSPGPDGVSGYFLANLANSIAYPIFILYNKSLEEGVFPSIWKISSITPVFKKGDKSNVKNYRPISGLVQIGKLLEKLVLAQIIKPINNILDNSQHGFRPGRSTLTCNLSLQNFILNAFNDNCQVDVIYTDFAKAFDRVDHELLIIILGKLGFSHPLLSWFKSYLTNRSQFTQVHGFHSETVPVPSGTP